MGLAGDFLNRRGELLEDEDGGENGGEGEEENGYFSHPGPTLTGRGDGGLVGEDEGEGNVIRLLRVTQIIR